MRSRSCFFSLLCCCLFSLAAHAEVESSSSSDSNNWYVDEAHRNHEGSSILDNFPFRDRRDGPSRRHEDSGTDLYRELGIDGTCRNARKPTCENGREPEKVNTGFCHRYVCPGGTTDRCPAVSKPICKDGTKLVTSVDSKGCPSATCQAVSVTCAQILCKEGTSPVNTGKTNSAGCPIMACKDTKTCPTYQRPLCKSTDTLTTELDANGCKKPVCQSSCPDYQKPICKDGKLILEKDKYGCERPTCSQTSTSCAQVLCKEGTSPVNTGKTNSAGCPIMACKEISTSTSCAQVLCKEGTTRVTTGTNSVGCPTYTCKETQTSTSCAQVLCKEGYSRVYVGQNNGGCPVYKCAPAGATSLVR